MPAVPHAVSVSPRHRLGLSRDYLHMIDTPPREDFVVRTLARRTAGKMTLMMGELVIAGAGTRDRFEAAARYPLHFRKTYYPGKMHGDPRIEFERHEFASRIIDVPAPIGHTPNSFRSCFLPGSPLNRLSALGVEPDESNIKIAQGLSLAACSGLWLHTQSAFSLLLKMQTEGLCHGDAHLHNFVVCPSPLETLPIDFEMAVMQDDVDATKWQEHCRADRQFLLKQAIFLQCSLGRQHGALADESMDALHYLVEPVKPFLRAITERTFDAQVD